MIDPGTKHRQRNTYQCNQASTSPNVSPMSTSSGNYPVSHISDGSSMASIVPSFHDRSVFYRPSSSPHPSPVSVTRHLKKYYQSFLPADSSYQSTNSQPPTGIRTQSPAPLHQHHPPNLAHQARQASPRPVRYVWQPP